MSHANAHFLAGGGKMGARIRAHDWSLTALGAPETWPLSLRSIVALILAAKQAMFLAWGPDLTFLYNDAYATALGTKHPHHALGRPLAEVWSDAWEQIRPFVELNRAGEGVYFEDLLVPMKRSGYPEEAWFTFSYTPVRDENGKIAGIFCAGSETTEKVRAEAALRESETRLQAAVDLVGVLPYAWNPITGELRWDARVKAIFGLPPDARVNHEVWLSALHREDKPRVEAAAASIDPSGSGVYHVEYRVISLSDGVERWVSAHGQTRFEGGQAVDHIGALVEITARKQTEERLRASEERFRQFAENSASVLWILNAEASQLEYLSPAFERVWGESRDTMMRNRDRWTEALHPDDREPVLAAVERALAGETIALEYRILRADHSVRWIRDTLFPVPDEGGTIRRIGGIAQDTARHEASLVYIIDGDQDTRDSFTPVLQRAGYTVKVFASVRAFLEAAPVLVRGCVMLDIRTPEAGGLAVPRELKARQISLPVVVVGHRGEVSLAVQAMKAGAIDYLEAPCAPKVLLAAAASALAEVHKTATRDRAAELARAQIAAMSDRERKVLEGLLAGGTNKTIAKELGISPRTVEVHRAHVMERLDARTLPEAVLMAMAAGLQPTQGSRSAENSELA